MFGFGKRGKSSGPQRSTRLFFGTDLHGSERTFRKFLNAGKFYQANVLVMGGDIVVPPEKLAENSVLVELDQSQLQNGRARRTHR